MSEILTVEEVAEVLLCDEQTAAERLKRGDLPGLKFGRSWIVPADSFYRRLNELAMEQSAARRIQSCGNPAGSDDESQAERPSTPKKRGRPRFSYAG